MPQTMCYDKLEKTERPQKHECLVETCGIQTVL